MIFEYDEFKEYIAEDFEEFYEWDFNEKQILLATLEEYIHVKEFGRADNICIRIFIALNYIERQLYYDEIVEELKSLLCEEAEEELKRDLKGEYFKYCMDLHMIMNRKSGGYIWKNRKDFNIEKTVRDIQLAAERSGSKAEIDTMLVSGKDYICMHGNVTNACADISQARNLRLAIYACPYVNDLNAETYIDKRPLPVGSNMGNVIYIEDVSNREAMLLQFLHEYLRQNPEDIFFAGDYRWYFTYEDIERIVQKRRIDTAWYYKDPVLKNVDYWDNHIEINGNRRDFECKIVQVLRDGEHYIVQHGSGTDSGIRNIYCLDENANIVWQLENLFERYPNAEKQGIEKMKIEDDVIIARDLAWKNEYYINIETGEVEKQSRYIDGGYEIISYPFL